MLCRCLSFIWTRRARIQKLWNRRREKMKWLKLKLLRVGSGLFKANTTLFWKRHAVTKFFKCNFPSLEWHGISLRHSNGFVAGTSGKKYSHTFARIYIYQYRSVDNKPNEQAYKKKINLRKKKNCKNATYCSSLTNWICGFFLFLFFILNEINTHTN